MKLRVITSTLLIVCGVAIGLLAFRNLMWAVWGKQNFWYEYVGFWGCPIMFFAGCIALKSLKFGSYLGLLGYGLMLFYFAPVLANTFRGIAIGGTVLKPSGVVLLAFIVVLPLVSLGRLVLNIVHIRSEQRA